MSRSYSAEPLVELMRHVRPGHVVVVGPTREQAGKLRSPLGREALSILQHFLHARRLVTRRGGELADLDPQPFPLTEQVVHQISARVGSGLGQKKSRRVAQLLVESGLLRRRGSYRRAYTRGPASPHRVALYFLARLVGGDPQNEASVGKWRSVKRQSERQLAERWWTHPLFGTPDGLPPPRSGWGKPGQRVREAA